MIELIEAKSNKLPNLTSIYFKLSFIDKSVEERISQQEIYYKDNKTGKFELPINRLFFLVMMLIHYDDVKFIPLNDKPVQWKSLKSYKFKVKPYSYQLEGIEYGLNHSGWLLLDDQGLGKTLQMIYLAEVLKKEEKLEHCLIICGVNSLKYNWAEEISKFSDLSYRILGQRINSKGKSIIGSVEDRCLELKNKLSEFFIITNIETLQNNKFVDAFKKSKNKFGMIVLDEAHKIKDPTSKAAKNILKLNSSHNIALTGTVIMNNPENAYMPLKWTNNLNSTFGMFKKMYCVYGGFGGVQIIGYKNLNLLQEHLANCSLRRLKSEVLDLPDKVYIKEYVDMGSKQQLLYNEVSKGIAEELDLLPKNKRMTIMQEITMNMRLRQITAFPGILNSNIADSAKLDRLEELLENIIPQGDKVVIFCTFKSCAKEVYSRFKQYNPLMCTGDQTDEEINFNKKEFQNNSTNKIIIATWQKMGTGVTLTAANYAIFIDTPWTNAEFQQCADRIYRIGQNKKCFIITLITKNTYDERVQEILDNKEILSDYLVDKKESDKLLQFSDYDN